MRSRALVPAAMLAALCMLTSLAALVPAGSALAAAASVSVSGPDVLTEDSAYAVTVAGGSTKVCRVQEDLTGVADFAAPYSLTIGLSQLAPGPRTLTFLSVDCQGYVITSVAKTVNVPVRVTSATPRWVAPSSTNSADHQFSLSVIGQSAPVTARIMKGSTVVTTLPSRSTTTASWTWKPGSAPAGAYTAEVTSGGQTVSIPVGVARGWAQMAPVFPRCRTITWSYSSKSQPKIAVGMQSDIASAFARIQKASGITFRQVSSKGTITLGWKKLSGADGEGGPTSQNGVAIKAQVWFNTGSTWVGRKGFGHDAHGNPGRGGLITHEVGHALGLGHVSDRKQIMYPVARAGSPAQLASGDTAGLKALYRAAAC